MDRYSNTRKASKKTDEITNIHRHKVVNKFSFEKLMMLLDKEKLKALGEEFREHPDGIELKDFVWLMKCAIDYEEDEKYDLVHGLCKLFDEIDINGDQHMEWTEFTQYIIDAVMQNPIKIPEREGVKEGEMNLIEQAHSQKLERFYPSSLLDKQAHEGTIQKVLYCQYADQLLVVESLSKEVKLITADCKHKKLIEVPFQKEGFVMSASINEKAGIVGVTTSDKLMYFFELISWDSRNEDKFKYKIIKKTDRQMGELQYGIWYSELHGAWITVGEERKKQVLSQWDLGQHTKQLLPITKFNDPKDCHSKRIMDLCPINNPSSIATCSLDKTIKIWDFLEGYLIATLGQHHSTGIRSLDYTSEYGGNILSVGHEPFINVWSPESSLARSYIGKISGHSAPVVDAKFLRKSFAVISVDDKFNIRVTDIRNLQPLQIITNEKSKFPVEGIIIFGAMKKFALFGRRFIFFDTKVEENTEVKGKALKEVFGIFGSFNRYYLNIIVVTKIDIRFYNAKTGVLENVFSDIVDSKTGAEISCCCLDDRHRKLIVGDAVGSVRIYNINNGLLIKRLGETEFTTNKGLKKIKREHTGEITNLHFVEEDKLIITTSIDSTLNIYDETRDSDSRLRNVQGGHGTSEIKALAFNRFQGLFATGAGNGSITIWDYEMTRVEGICQGHTKPIIALEFVAKYPVLASIGMDSYLLLWGIRSSPLAFRYCCIARFPNIGQLHSTNYLGPIQAIKVHSFKGSALIPKGNPLIGESELMSVYEQIFDEDDDLLEKRKKEEERKSYKGYFRKSLARKNQQTDEEEKARRLSSTRNSILSFDHYANMEEDSAIMDRTYIYSGDEKGFLRIWDITAILNKEGINKISSYVEDKTSFNPHRKEDKNAFAQLSIQLNSVKGKLPKITAGEIHTILNCWRGHREGISVLTLIDDPKSFLTTAYDKHFKLWSVTGDLLGDIDLSIPKPIFWRFPYNWEKEKQRKRAQIENVLEAIQEKTTDQDIIEFEDEELFPSQKQGKKRLVGRSVGGLRKKYKAPGEESVGKEELPDLEQEMAAYELLHKRASGNVSDLHVQLKSIMGDNYQASTPYGLLLSKLIDDYEKPINEHSRKKIKKKMNEISNKMGIMLHDQSANDTSNWRSRKIQLESDYYKPQRNAATSNSKTTSSIPVSINEQFKIPKLGSGLANLYNPRKMKKRRKKREVGHNSMSNILGKSLVTGGSSGILKQAGRKLVLGMEMANKAGDGRYLRKLPVTNLKPKTDISHQYEDMRYHRGEGGRQLCQAISQLSLQKESSIDNYNLADNKMLYKHRQMMNYYTKPPLKRSPSPI